MKKIKIHIFLFYTLLLLFLGNGFGLKAQISESKKNTIEQLLQDANHNIQINNKNAALADYNKIAAIYEKNEIFDQSILYYNKALDLSKQLNINYAIARAEFKLFNLYKRTKQWDKAMKIGKNKLSSSRKGNNKKSLANNLIQLSYVQRKAGIYNDAITNLEEALKISLFELRDEQLSLNCYKELANNYKLLENVQKYNEYINLITKIENEKTTTKLQNKTKTAEHIAVEKEQQIKEQNTQLNLMGDSLVTVSDSLIEITKLTHEQQLKLDLKEARIKSQQVELKLSRYINFFLLTILLITLIFLFFLYRLYLQKREALNTVSMQKEEILQQKEEIQTQSDELESQRDELFKSNKTKEKLLSVVAHDLKNPIHALIGFSDLLINDKNQLSLEEQEQYIHFINNSAIQIHQLLENLLKWAQSQSSGIRYNPEQFNISDLIELNTTLFYEAAKRKGIKLIKNDKNRNLVFADKNMINTVIRNLINNAIKFTPEDGTISILCKNKNDKLEISVADTGVGMDKEIIYKLLNTDEFHSSNGTLEEPGTGLGLAISKEFLNAHKSQLKIESKPDDGSVFYFELPKSNE